MPFQSEKQRRYLWANEPEIARDWTDTYGSGIAKALGGRIGFKEGKGPGWAAQQVLNKKNQELKNLQAQKEQMEQMGMDTTEIDRGIQSIENFVQGHVEKHNLDPVKEKEGAIGGYGALGSNIEAAPRSKYPSLGEVWEERIGPEGTDEERNKRLEEELYDTQGLYGDKINEEGLMKLMKGDPLADSYGLTNNMDLVKSFAEDPRRPEEMGAKAQSLMDDYGTFGYTYGGGDDSIYIRDLNKFTNQPDINNPNTMGNIYETNKQIADVIGHERRHRLLDDPKFSDIRKKYEAALPNTLDKHDQEEIFNRIMDLKSGQLRGRLEGDKWGTTQMKGDYRDMDFLDYALQNTENIPMKGTGFNAMQKLDPIANEFIQRAQSGITSAAPVQGPHAGMMPPAQYGKGQTQDDDDDDQQSWWRSLFSPKNVTRGLTSFAANKMGLGMFAGIPGLALSMFRGGNRGPAINPATQQFMQNYGVGRDPQTGRMTSGPFAGRNLPGTSMFGSKTPKEMAQNWVEKYGDKQYTTKKQQQKQQQIKNIATMNQGPPGGGGGGNGGGGGGFSGAGAGTGASGPPGRNYNKGGLAALWPR